LGEEEKKLVREAVEKVSVSEKELMNRLHVEEELITAVSYRSAWIILRSFLFRFLHCEGAWLPAMKRESGKRR